MRTKTNDPRSSDAAASSTRTDLRLTRAPADTPRGRLHRLAARGVQASQEAKRVFGLSRDEVAGLRRLARRAHEAVHLDCSRGARLITHLAYGLDQALGALALLDPSAVGDVCDGVIVTLVQLEVAEAAIRGLRGELDEASRDLKFERDHVEQMRALLADAQARAAALLQDVPQERWSEETRKREVSLVERRTIDGSSAK